MPLWFSRLVALLIPEHDDRTEALCADLVRLAAIAEAEHCAPSIGCAGLVGPSLRS